MIGDQSGVECPQCGYGSAFHELQPETLEEYTFCFQCGYTLKLLTLTNQEKEAIDQKYRIHYKLTDNGKRPYHRIEKKGLGVYRVVAKNGFGETGRLAIPLTEDIIEGFNQAFNHELAVTEKCYLTRWNEETKKAEVVFGKLEHPSLGAYVVPWDDFHDDSE
jgi:hypothetical protein